MKDYGALIIIQIYVDDIVFWGMSSKMIDYFVQQRQAEFEMSMVGKHIYFLGFQVKSMKDEIFVSQS